MIPGKEEKGRGESESRREEKMIKDELQRSPLHMVQQLTRVLLSLGELSDKTQLSPHSSTAENSLPHIDRLFHSTSDRYSECPQNYRSGQGAGAFIHKSLPHWPYYIT